MILRAAWFRWRMLLDNDGSFQVSVQEVHFFKQSKGFSAIIKFDSIFKQLIDDNPPVEVDCAVVESSTDTYDINQVFNCRKALFGSL